MNNEHPTRVKLARAEFKKDMIDKSKKACGRFGLAEIGDGYSIVDTSKWDIKEKAL